MEPRLNSRPHLHT